MSNDDEPPISFVDRRTASKLNAYISEALHHPTQGFRADTQSLPFFALPLALGEARVTRGF